MCGASCHSFNRGWHVPEAVKYGATVGVAGDEIYVARLGGKVPLNDLRSRVIKSQKNVMTNILTTDSECCDMGEVNSTAGRCNICIKSCSLCTGILDPECLFTPRVRKPNGYI